MTKAPLFFLILGTLLLACNPVKKVMKDPVKFNEVAQEVIRRGYCANDTTIVVQVSDTVFIRTEDLVDTLVMEYGMCNFDTILKTGTSIKFENGTLFVREKVQYRERVITNRVDNFIRDKALEDLLRKDIAAYRDTVISLRGAIEVHKEQIKKANTVINRHKTYFYIGLVALLVLGILKVIKIIKPL